MANNKSSKTQTLFRAVFFLAAAAWVAAGCSTAHKKTPELSKMEGKKVALVEVSGESTAQRVVEAALINQLVRTGSFILIPKQEIDTARTAPDLNPLDAQALARRVGADYSLRAKVLRFDADTHEGYSSETVEDSQLKAEMGDGKTERLYKVQSLDTAVQVQLEFTELKTSDTRTGIAEANDHLVAEAKDSAIHLPPKLRHLEKVAQEAFRKFFEQYH